MEWVVVHNYLRSFDSTSQNYGEERHGKNTEGRSELTSFYWHTRSSSQTSQVPNIESLEMSASFYLTSF